MTRAVKCSPAVGAAAESGAPVAYSVWYRLGSASASWMYGGSGASPAASIAASASSASNVTQRPPGCAPEGPITVACRCSPMRMTAPGAARSSRPCKAEIRALRSSLEHEELDLAPVSIDPAKARISYARLVGDQQVARPQQSRQLDEPPILELAVLADEQQTRRIALGERLLRDPLGRERVVEVGSPQRSKSAVCASAAPYAPAGTGSPRC